MWIESHQELARHPKTKRLARQLGVGLPTAIGHLHCLWWWALDFAQDGDLDRYGIEEIADAGLWQDDPVAFVAALVAAGFLDAGADEDDLDAYRLHDWDDYGGKLVERRSANAAKQKAWRDRQRDQRSEPPDPPEGNVPERVPQAPSNVTVTSGVRNGATVPNSTVPNSTVPKALSPLPPTREASVQPEARASNVTVTLRAVPKAAEIERAAIEAHPLYDALKQLFGPVTSRDQDDWTADLAVLDELGARPEDIARAAAGYAATMGHDRTGRPMAMTRKALIKHWYSCLHAPLTQPRAPTDGRKPVHPPLDESKYTGDGIYARFFNRRDDDEPLEYLSDTSP